MRTILNFKGYDEDGVPHFLHMFNSASHIPSVGDDVVLWVGNENTEIWTAKSFRIAGKVESIVKTYEEVYPRTGKIDSISVSCFVDVIISINNKEQRNPNFLKSLIKEDLQFEE